MRRVILISVGGPGKGYPPSLLLLGKILEYPFDSIFAAVLAVIRNFSLSPFRAIGVDVRFIPEAEERAQEFAYTLIEGSWEKFPLASFDTGFSHQCLEHARDPTEWLSECARIVKLDCKFFVFMPCHRADVLADHVSSGWKAG